ncbi:unnamed protein product [Ceutorhynchus assimilis]|uniref:THAP-type domain-containing protein n=1 Tax=Ceutorhynchus assimilis TaxID=467358 RepID=A0A9N9MHZ4_9CUCU|nr:unnamed protein product [Ceutorhynchus assimilis]
MPMSCLVFGCTSRANRDVVSFHSIPTELSFRFLTHKNDLSRKRRAAWIAALRRNDLTMSKIANYKTNGRICSRHFITGKPSPLENEDDPDWIPSLYMGYDGDVFPSEFPRYKKRRQAEVVDVDPVALDTKPLEIPIIKTENIGKEISHEMDMDGYEVPQKSQDDGEIETREDFCKMEDDLLLKEDEFYKENEKLELRTKQLLVKVNDVMKIQDNLIKDTYKTRTELNEVIKGNKYPKKTIPEETLRLLDEAKNDERLGSANTDRILRVFKGKFIAAEADKEKLQNELRQKNEEAKKLQKENQMLKEEKEKWFLSYNSGKNTIGKLESQITNISAKLQSKETENACLKKELEHLKKQLKNGNLNFNNCEVRLTRACEENEKLKGSLKQAKEEEKDLKDGYRKQLNELTSVVKHLEKQKIELLNGFKKQTQLIDVLKKQKIHVEALKLGEMTEAEYLKILDWNFDK